MAQYFTVKVESKAPHNTLWGIASKYLGDGNRYPEIKRLNGLTSDVIHVGQVLKVYEIKEETPDVKKALNDCLNAIATLPEFQTLMKLL